MNLSRYFQPFVGALWFKQKPIQVVKLAFVVIILIDLLETVVCLF